MRGSRREILEYATDVALLLERCGVRLTSTLRADDLVFREVEPEGYLAVTLTGTLPGDGGTTAGDVLVRERFTRTGRDVYERAEYAYDLIDHERDCRRGFHLHSREWFAREHLVLVHEHCERPIGHVACRHYESTPIRDGFAGVMVLMEIWTGPAPDCADLRCLE